MRTKTICLKGRKKTFLAISMFLLIVISVFFGIYDIHNTKALAQSNPNELVQQGRNYLTAHDIINAHQSFEAALASDPVHPEANLFYSVTRILVLVYQTDFNNLLDRFGVSTEDRNLYNWTASFPSPLPTDSPTSGEVIAFLTDTVLPQVEGALGNLAIIDNSFEVILTAEEMEGDEDLEVDYGDILLYKSMLNMVKGVISILDGYNLDVDIDDIVNAEDGICDISYDKIIQDTTLLTVKDSAKILSARAAILQSINDYLDASDFIRTEPDAQADDFITIEPEDLDGEKKIRLILTQVKDSLEGVTTAEFTVQLSQFLDLGQFFTNPVNLRDLLFGGGIQNILTNHHLPQIDRALSNLSGVDKTFIEILTPDTFPTNSPIEVDFGDIAMVRALLYSSKAAINIITAYNIDVDIFDISDKVAKDTFKINDLLITYSSLLNLHNGYGLLGANRLKAAKTAVNDAIDVYLEASEFIRNESDDQTDDLATIDPDELEDEAEFRARLAEIEAAKSGPAEIRIDDPFILDLTQFFDESINLREFLPNFTEDNKIIIGTFPDPTFSGILPDFTQEDLTEAVDDCPPESTLVPSGNLYYDSTNYYAPLDFTYSLSTTDNYSGVERIEYSIDGSAFVEFSAAFSLDSEGSHTISYKALDKAGNWEQTKSTTIIVDITPLATPIGFSGELVSSDTIRLTWTANSEQDLAGYNLYRDDVKLNEQLITSFTYHDSPINPTAVYTYKVSAVDWVGNESTLSDSIIVRDNIPPETTLISSGNLYYDGENYYASIDFTYSLSTTDNYSGVERIEYSINGSAFVEFTEAFSLDSEGSHTISYKALDKVGNWEQAKSTIIIVDTTAPSVPTGLSGSQFNFQVSLSWQPNSEPDIWGYNVYRDGTKINTQLVTWTSYSDLIMSGKVYTYNVTAVDRIGNESLFSASISITTLSNAPTITYPWSGAVLLDSEITVRGNTEPGATVEVFVNGVSQGTTLASSWGSFSLSGVSISEGENMITAIATNPYGVISPESSTVTVFLDLRPQPPSGLKAVPGDTVITLSWDSNPEADITGYRVYRDGSNTPLNVNLLTSTQFMDIRLTDGKDYIYTVVAVDQRGSQSEMISKITVAPVAGPEWEVP